MKEFCVCHEIDDHGELRAKKSKTIQFFPTLSAEQHLAYHIQQTVILQSGDENRQNFDNNSKKLLY